MLLVGMVYVTGRCFDRSSVCIVPRWADREKLFLSDQAGRTIFQSEGGFVPMPPARHRPIFDGAKGDQNFLVSHLDRSVIFLGRKVRLVFNQYLYDGVSAYDFFFGQRRKEDSLWCPNRLAQLANRR